MARHKTASASGNGLRREDVEEWLESNTVDWSYEGDFPLADIDREQSLNNQARVSEPLNEDMVEQYREALRRGDMFPGIVVARGGPQAKAVVIDGNHRMEAGLREGLETYGAYVVQARPNTTRVQDMTMSANNLHGLLPPREDRIQHALWKIATKRLGAERAAAEVNLPVSVVRSRYDKVRADRRADEVGLRRSDWESLIPTVRTRLLAVGTDEGFKAAARLAIAAQLTSAQVDDMVTALNEFSRSAAKQQSIVRALRRDYADRIAQVASGALPTGRAAAFTPRRRLTLALSNLRSLPEDFAATAAATFSEDERHQAAQEAHEAAQRLEQLAVALGS
jgi:hypothetical protein